MKVLYASNVWTHMLVIYKTHKLGIWVSSHILEGKGWNTCYWLAQRHMASQRLVIVGWKTSDPNANAQYDYQREIIDPFGNIVLVTLLFIFWKYVWVKKCIQIHVMIFKNWKYVFKHMYQTFSISLHYTLLNKHLPCRPSLYFE